jgi:four helix bundle protein
MGRFQDLLAWQRCHALVIATYRATAQWPDEERFGLTAQLRRAVVSAAANIAEGNTRKGPKEFRRFLHCAVGSLAEAGYLVRLGLDLDLSSQDTAEALLRVRDDAAKMTWCLLRAVNKRCG